MLKPSLAVLAFLAVEASLAEAQPRLARQLTIIDLARQSPLPDRPPYRHEVARGCDVAQYGRSWITGNGAKLTWKGACADGLANGQGTLTVTLSQGRKETFVGEMAGGFFSKGAYTAVDGTRREGQFVNGAFTSGKIFTADGAIRFDGSISNSKYSWGKVYFNEGGFAQGAYNWNARIEPYLNLPLIDGIVFTKDSVEERWFVGGREYASRAEYGPAMEQRQKAVAAANERARVELAASQARQAAAAEQARRDAAARQAAQAEQDRREASQRRSSLFGQLVTAASAAASTSGSTVDKLTAASGAVSGDTASANAGIRAGAAIRQSAAASNTSAGGGAAGGSGAPSPGQLQIESAAHCVSVADMPRGTGVPGYRYQSVRNSCSFPVFAFYWRYTGGRHTTYNDLGAKLAAGETQREAAGYSSGTEITRIELKYACPTKEFVQTRYREKVTYVRGQMDGRCTVEFEPPPVGTAK